MRKHLWKLFLIPLLLPVSLQAEDVYRTVDDSGQVTFTDSPADDASEKEKLSLPPAQQPEAQKSRAQKIINMMRESDRNRKEKKRLRREEIEQAEQALHAAEERLESAKQIDASDRQSLVGGRSKIRPEYFERLEKAEAEVEEARKRLQKARGY
jgi:hypothetical protein